METARVTARQVAESMSPQELREAAKEFRVHPNPFNEGEPSAEDIAQLLEYIADLREPDAICPHCGWDYREARN